MFFQDISFTVDEPSQLKMSNNVRAAVIFRDRLSSIVCTTDIVIESEVDFMRKTEAVQNCAVLLLISGIKNWRVIIFLLSMKFLLISFSPVFY